MEYLFGNCRLDSALRELRRDGEIVHVEPQVFDLIVHLIRNRDRVVSRDDLLESLWQGRIVSESTFRSRLNAARAALGDTGKHKRFIQTLPRRGLRFVGEVVETPARPAAADDPVPEPGSGSPDDSRPVAPESGSRPVVVILPFRNLGGDPEWDHYADGITEDITTALAKHRSLLIVARNSAFAFKGYGGDVRHIGLELGADYIVEGSIRKIPQRVCVTAHLVERKTGRVMWADRYDRELDSIFDVQDTITAKIAATVEPQISLAEQLRIERGGPGSFHAWELFHLGTRHLYKATPQDNREAQRLLRLAIEDDPGLAQGHAFLSYAILLSMLYFDAEPETERLKEAQNLAARSIELDRQDAMVRFVYGRVLLARQHYASALDELKSAVEMNPALAVGHCGIGDSLAYEGRFEEAFPCFQKALDLSPHDPQRWAFYAYRALAHLFARQFDLADEWARKSTRVPHCHDWPFSHRVSALGHLGHRDTLKSAVEELLERKPEFTRDLARKRLFYVKNESHLDIYLEGLRKAGIPDVA